ncbi:MAG: glycosyl hydrolase 115 family protein [Bacteroidaceae bacterium]|nr:glycosyl hydrolase 115 family protein [Bacteroidaceae bacterium]
MLRYGIQKFALTAVMAMIALTSQASAFVLPAHQRVDINVNPQEARVVTTAVSLLESDLQRVLDASVRIAKGRSQILVGTWNGPAHDDLAATGVDCSWLEGNAQAFVLAVAQDGRLVIAGSDAYGTAYGIIELTRLLGVSAWEWWADVDIEPKSEFRLDEGFRTEQAPDVSFRGICIGDEDWGLMPWSASNYEPSAEGQVGAQTTQRIFELMLRLRANIYWPPSRPCTRPFEHTEGCRTLAAYYGITLGKDVQEPISIPNYPSPLICEDDGFGYIRHFPTYEESGQSRGCGVYYHASYQGAPHDYLWLGTASPFLMCQQLTEAYQAGANRLWVLNVGDIKPLEYQISLFTDMAWNLEAVRQLTVGTHLEEFYAQTIGRDVARLTSVYMKEFFQLSFQCKPEHLAGTRVGEPGAEWNAVRDLPWSEQFIRHRLSRYDLMRRNVKWVGDSVRRTHPHRTDAYFELVEYPVMSAVAQNEKYLCAQLARHGISYLQRDNVDSTWMRSDLGHNRVQELTIRYNELRNGKWRGMMSSNPNNLAVFQPVPHIQSAAPMPADEPAIATFYGASYDAASFSGSSVLAPVLGLGASIRAMPIPRGHEVTYRFKHNFLKQRVATIELRMLPTHPIEEYQRIQISLDGGAPQTFMYDTEVGSEAWKQNVTRGFAVVTSRLTVVKPMGDHSLVVKALDDGVVVDEVFIRP